MRQSKRHVLRISVGRIWHGGKRRKVVEPVQAGLVGDRIDTAEKEVDVVGLARPQARGQLSADEVGEGGRRKIGLVPHRVQLGIRLDVFGELDYISARR